MIRLVTALSLAVLAAAAAAQAGGGPYPGIVQGRDGIAAADRGVRYVALPAGARTTVAEVALAGGRMLRHRAIPGRFGVARVAFDGTADGLSGNGRTLILAGAPGAKTRFAVLDTATLRHVRTIELPGAFSLDAVSRDGSTMFVIEHLAETRYRVRAVDVGSGTLLSGIINDRKQELSVMVGEPISRAFDSARRWAYTLYRSADSHAFVHALDTRTRMAVCVDLPWHEQNGLWQVRLRAARGTLDLVRGGRRLAAIDTTRFTVKTFAAP